MKSLGALCLVFLTVALVWIGVGKRRAAIEPALPLHGSHGVGTEKLVDPVARAPWSEGQNREEIKGKDSIASAAEPGVVTVHATVRDMKGLPLAAVRLTAMSVEGAPSASSDAEGQIALVIRWKKVARMGAQRCLFRLHAEGFTTQEASLDLPEAGEFFLKHFTMKTGGAVTGRVIDVHGIPLSGAFVYCIEPSSTWSKEDHDAYRFRRMRPLSNVVQSDEKGEYAIEGVAPSTYSVSASLPGKLGAFSDPIAVDSSMTGAVPDLVLEVPSREFLISGSVLDRDGKPLEGVPVELTDLPGSRYGLTDGAGAFLIVTEAGSRGRIRVRADPPRYGAMVAYDVPAGTEGLVLRPQEERTLSIRVRTADGRVPAGLAAHANPLGGGQEHGTYVQSEDGASLKLVVPQRAFTVSITAHSYEMFRTASIDPGALPQELEILLEPVLGLVGFVRHEGQPFLEAEIDAHVARRDGRLAICENGLHDRFETNYRFKAKSDRDGRFVLKVDPDLLLNKGIESISLHATASGFAQGVLQVVKLMPVASMPEVTLELIRGGAVQGRVIAEDGRDLRGLLIAVSQGDSHFRQAALDALGKFHIGGLSPGTWQAVTGTKEEFDRGARERVGLIAADEMEWSFSVTEGETTSFDLVLAPASEAKVEFNGHFLVNGAPPVGWTWEFPEREDHHKGRLDAKGRFGASLDKAGPRSLYVHAPRSGECGASGLVVELNLVDGRNAWSYDLSTATVLVTGPPKPVADPDERVGGYAQLSWQYFWKDDSLGLAWHGSFYCAPEGGLRLAHVPAGSLTFQRVLRSRVIESSTLQLELAPGEVRELKLNP